MDWVGTNRFVTGVRVTTMTLRKEPEERRVVVVKERVIEILRCWKARTAFINLIHNTHITPRNAHIH
jgi:hypothetical protein